MTNLFFSEQRELSVAVAGKPPTLGANGEIAESWKRSTAETVAAAWRHDYIEEPCKVDLTFNLPLRLRRTALFNQLKAPIDALAHVLFAPAHERSGDWNRQDWWITELHAKKRVGEGAAASEFRVRPSERLENDDAKDGEIRRPVLGSPPLWPGDAVGQAKVAAWAAKFTETFPELGYLATAESVGVGIDVTVEPARMRTADLDNFCVPICQAVVRGLSPQGLYTRPDRISELHARKILSAEMPPSVLIRIWPTQ